MRRREFIMLVGGTVLAWPFPAWAQQPAMPVVGVLSSSSPDGIANRMRAFHQGLSETGYVEGRNIAIEYRWANYEYDRLPALAADLVRRRVAVIASLGGVVSALAVKAATTTIPTVFQVGVDPVQLGLVASLNRPGGNLTGVTVLTGELIAKQLELLHEMVPAATVIAALINTADPNGRNLSRNLEAAAGSLGLQVHVLHANSARDFEAVFTTLRELRAGALVIAGDSVFSSITGSTQLGALALRHAMPTIFENREFASAGGLLSYGGSVTEASRLVGLYTGRILKGDKPADLPVQQPTKFELVINLKTAKVLGLTVPPNLLATADEVIE